jgi:DNA-directed RNA polymerase specialized sigma24 family protein
VSNETIPFDEFVEKFTPGLFDYVLSLTYGKQLADDAVQEGIIHAWSEHQKNPQVRKFTLFKAAKLRALRYIQRRDDTGRDGKGVARDPLRRTGEWGAFSDWEGEDGINPMDNLEYKRQPPKNEAVINALDVLTPKQREWVESRFWEMAPSQVIRERGLRSAEKSALKILEKELEHHVRRD